MGTFIKIIFIVTMPLVVAMFAAGLFAQTTGPTTAHYAADGNVAFVDVPPRKVITPPTTVPSTQPIPVPPTTQYASGIASPGSITFSATQGSKGTPQSVKVSGNAGTTYYWHDNYPDIGANGTDKVVGSGTVTLTPDLSTRAAGYVQSGVGTVSTSISGGVAVGSVLLNTIVTAPSGGTTTPVTPPNSGLGATEPAIAAYFDVPNQLNPTRFSVGAWHVNAAGIGSVDFAVDGKSVGVATAMTANPQTLASDYNVAFNPTSVATGQHMLVATVYPIVGVKTVLPAFPFTTGATGTTTTKTGGGEVTLTASDASTVLLGPGTWNLTVAGSTANTFFNIKAAPGATRGQVVVKGPGGGNWFSNSAKHLHFDGVTVMAGVHSPAVVWFSNCDLTGGDRYAQNWSSGWYWSEATFDGSQANPWINHGYITDSHVFACHEGASHITLNRNVTIDKLAGVALDGCATMVGVTVSDISRVQQPLVHSDVYHGYARTHDVILYNVNATAGGITEPGGQPESRIYNFFETGSVGGNLAVINCTGDSAGGQGTALELAKCVNGLIKNSTLTGPSIVYSDMTLTDVVFEGVKFVGSNPDLSKVTAR